MSTTSPIAIMVFNTLVISISYDFGYKQNKPTLDYSKKMKPISKGCQIEKKKWWKVEELNCKNRWKVDTQNNCQSPVAIQDHSRVMETTMATGSLVTLLSPDKIRSFLSLHLLLLLEWFPDWPLLIYINHSRFQAPARSSPR